MLDGKDHVFPGICFLMNLLQTVILIKLINEWLNCLIQEIYTVLYTWSCFTIVTHVLFYHAPTRVVDHVTYVTPLKYCIGILYIHISRFVFIVYFGDWISFQASRDQFSCTKSIRFYLFSIFQQVVITQQLASAVTNNNLPPYEKLTGYFHVKFGRSIYSTVLLICL